MAAPTPEDIQAGIPPTAQIVARRPGPNGGEILLDANGGVYNTGGSKFHGSYFSLDPQHRQGERSFQDIEIDPKTGGYTLVSSTGERYAFGTDYLTPEQAAEKKRKEAEAASIYQDPSYLAFVRGADLSLEEAARQVARRQQALQTGLANSTVELGQQGEQERRGIDNSFEARGVFRSGARAVRNAEQEQRQAQSLSKLQQGTAEQIATEQESLASKVAQVQREAGEKGYNVAQTQDLDKRMEGLRAKYPGQFAGSA